MGLLTKQVDIWGVKFEADYYHHDADEPNVLESVEIDGVFVEGSEQDLYEVISDDVLQRIIEKIHDSHE
jgi:hypothetical protein